MLQCLMLQSLDAKLDVRQLLQMTHLATLKQSLPITRKYHVTCESSEVAIATLFIQQHFTS